MKLRRLFLSAIFVFPLACSAASKEIVELQRDVAQLQDQLRNLQSSFDIKIAALTVLVQQAVDASNKNNNALAALQGGIQEQMRQQGKELIGPVAGLGVKVDQMATEFQEVRNSMSDVTNRLGKMEQQIIDLGNAVRTIPPAAAPPPANPTGATAPAANVPPIPAEVLYSNANRDRIGGKSDLAMQEFSDYLKYYGDTQLASAAQFWIGDYYFSQGDYDNALKAFDLVLKAYPANNNKAPDALYMKGRTLVKLEQRNAAANEFRELIRRYPGSDAATKAKSQLKAMGLSISASRRR